MSTEEDKRYINYTKTIETEIRKLKNELDDLSETVYKGNGKPSLVTRVNSVEGKLSGLRDTMEDKLTHVTTEHTLRFEQLHQKLENKFGRLEGWIETKMEGIESLLTTVLDERKINKTGAWQLRAAVIGAIAGLIGIIITILLK